MTEKELEITGSCSAIFLILFVILDDFSRRRELIRRGSGIVRICFSPKKICLKFSKFSIKIFRGNSLPPVLLPRWTIFEVVLGWGSGLDVELMCGVWASLKIYH